MDWLTNFWQPRKELITSLLVAVTVSSMTLFCGVYLVAELWKSNNITGLIALAVLTIMLSISRS